MATLVVRELPDEVHAALKARAGALGISMEALAREVLAEAATRRSTWDGAALQQLVSRLYEGKPPRAASTDLIRERRKNARKE